MHTNNQFNRDPVGERVGSLPAHLAPRDLNDRSQFAVNRLSACPQTRRVSRSPVGSRFNGATRLRAGSTLTEVLVALMIMSIGLVSLAVLFPMSVLRSIKASQFTNATDLRFNAEAMIDMFPNLVRNPDYHMNAAGTALDPTFHNPENFVVDPLGFAIINQSNNLLSLYFGNADPSDQALTNPPSANPLNPAANSWTFRRYSGAQFGAILTEPSADHLVTLPDSWELLYEGIPRAGTIIMDPKAAVPVINGATQLDLPGLGALGLTISPTNALRVVIFSADGVTSQARTITALGQIVVATDTADTLKWTEDTDSTGTFAVAKDFNGNGTLDDNSLPPSFVVGGLGKVRVEQQDRRYTWMLTVRKNAGGIADVDVVVFFKRPFEDFQTTSKGQAGDEVLFPAQIIQGNTVVTNVTYPVSRKPFMRKGNYIFDANNAYWYRISNVSPPTQTTLPGNVPGESVTITIDVPANAANTNGPLPPRVMFPRAVVDVYPIGTKN